MDYCSVKIADVKPGDTLIADAGFFCVNPGPVVVKGVPGALYFECACGRHDLDGQLDFDEGQTLVGLAHHVTQSCGCVFCDLGIEPEETANGTWTHTADKGNERVKCTNPEYQR